VQKQIHIFLEQASDVLDQAHQLMHRRLGVGQSSEPTHEKGPLPLTAMSTNLSAATLTADLLTLKRPRLFQRIRRSLLDKKRVESIVGEFSELNSRIHENIKLWCLGTSIGVDLRHLRHLESDPNSRALGFDIDARLQMATSQGEHAVSLEIDEWEVKTILP
jgi:hypothetical protein